VECDTCCSTHKVLYHDGRHLCSACRAWETARELPGHPAHGHQPPPALDELLLARVYRDGFRAGRRSLNGTAA
jgi:hypothetical protein